ncbi:MAG: virulence RhuM family protein [Methanobrevibacter sp.]|jgi:hypothetical protein|nr:virulence RhuM family protein [Methanobrevibacter sp.]
MIKCFVLDDELLKKGTREDYFDELIGRIRRNKGFRKKHLNLY